MAVLVTVPGIALVDMTEEMAPMEGATGGLEEGGEAEVVRAGDVGEARLLSDREGKAGTGGVFCPVEAATDAETEAADDSLFPCWLVEELAVTPLPSPSPCAISAADCPGLDLIPSEEEAETDVETETETGTADCCVVAGRLADATAGGEGRGFTRPVLYAGTCLTGAAREGRIGTFETVRVAEESRAADTERGAEEEEDTRRLAPFGTHEGISVTWGAATTYADRTDRARNFCA